MNFNVITEKIVLADGREITIETGKLAKQADGAVVVRMGDTMLLATVVSAQEAKPGTDFLPLSVDYQEKFAAAGRIPGGFLRREGRLSDHEVLICRLVDRALRPLFPDDYHADTQVIITLISADLEALPDALACLAASAALAVSDIPFNGPVSEVRVGRHNGQFIINPPQSILAACDIDMIVAATEKDVMMVEGEMSEISEEDMIEAIDFAHQAIKDQCRALRALTLATNKSEKRTYCHEVHDAALKEDIFAKLYEPMYNAAKSFTANKNLRSQLFKEIKEQYMAALPEDHGYDSMMLKSYLHEVQKKATRDMVLNERRRLDGRALDEIRDIACEIDYLPSAHGSALFTRGETQSLSSVTLGTKLDEQMIDGVLFSGTSKFMLHYNFPAFSTGEVKPNRGPGRREVGHGNLAMRALKKVLPPADQNPYTIRIVSDILESNGSSSMATVCAGSLSLMDAGVKISGPVSGIAMGMISEGERYAILSDILGDEDHLGDMDFKVTGTSKGITACQMDIKVDGLSYDVLRNALQQANAGRAHILGKMNEVISESRAELKPNAPRIVTLDVPTDTIGAIIGTGGKVIQEIQRQTGATVVIEEVPGKGVVSIYGTNLTVVNAALERIKQIIFVPEIGQQFEATVKTITAFGAFLEFLPGKEGLLHISDITWERLETMDGVLEVGEQVMVQLSEIDKKTGKYKLSRKVLLPKPEGYVEPVRTHNPDRQNGGGGYKKPNHSGGKPYNKR